MAKKILIITICIMFIGATFGMTQCCLAQGQNVISDKKQASEKHSCCQSKQEPEKQNVPNNDMSHNCNLCQMDVPKVMLPDLSISISQPETLITDINIDNLYIINIELNKAKPIRPPDTLQLSVLQNISTIVLLI